MGGWMVELVREAVRSLRLHRLRATLSALGIVCGVMSFVAMLSLSEGARRETLASIEQLGMRNVLVRGTASITLDDALRLRAAVPSITRVAAVREVRASVVEPAHMAAPLVLAMTPSYLDVHGLEVASGRTMAEEDLHSRSLVCVLGQEVSRRLGPVGQPGSVLRIEGSVCRVVGVLRHFERRDPKGSSVSVRDFDNVVAVPLGAERAFDPDPDPTALSELVAEMRSADDVMAWLPAVRRALEVAHRGADDYRVIAPQELLRQAQAARRNFDVLAASLAVLCLLAGGIGIMNTLLAS